MCRPPPIPGHLAVLLRTQSKPSVERCQLICMQMPTRCTCNMNMGISIRPFRRRWRGLGIREPCNQRQMLINRPHGCQWLFCHKTQLVPVISGIANSEISIAFWGGPFWPERAFLALWLLPPWFGPSLHTELVYHVWQLVCAPPNGGHWPKLMLNKPQPRPVRPLFGAAASDGENLRGRGYRNACGQRKKNFPAIKEN